jgi:hypothetical protein
MRQSGIGRVHAANLDYLFAAEDIRDRLSDIAFRRLSVSIPPLADPKPLAAGAGIFACALMAAAAGSGCEALPCQNRS